MGGRPISSLAMVCFPEKEDLQTLGQILAGGLSKMIEAGCTVIGGHSIRDDEIKFGYAVTGSGHPDRILANGGAKAGDVLVLTKALGTGVISTAIKKGKAELAWIETVTKSMTTLNKLAAEAAAELGGDVHGATDITGFGLIGHAREVALASNVSLRIDSAKIPLLAGAVEGVGADCVPAALKANRDFAECAVEFGPKVDEITKTLLFDPQTAGGLLLSISAKASDQFLRALQNRGGDAMLVGEGLPRPEHLILLV